MPKYPAEIVDLMCRMWKNNPAERPNIAEARALMNEIVPHTAEVKSLHRHVPSRKTPRRYHMKPEAAPPLRPIAGASHDEV